MGEHLFKPGESGNPAGKPKGTQAKVTREAKAMIEAALHKAGQNVQKQRRSLKDLEPGAAYLADQAEKNPVAFMSLVGKLVPQKIDVDVQVMSQQMMGLLEERRAALAASRGIIEHQPVEEETNDDDSSG